MSLHNPFNKKRAAAIAAVSTIVFLYARRGRASTRRTSGGGGGPCSIAPYTWNEQVVKAQIATQFALANTATLTTGQTVTPERVTKAVAQALYPQGTWPPGPNAPANALCLWDQLVDAVGDFFGSKPSDPQKNWPAIINPLIKFGLDAQPGNFLQIEYQKPPTLWSHSEIKNKPGILDVILENAGIPNNRANRKALYNAIVCCPWNDATLGVEGEGANTGISLYKPAHNRGISLNPVYADNLQRMLNGQPPRRRATSATSPSGGSLPLIWIPDIERGQPTVIVKIWPDGMSAINPPAEVLELGLDNVPPGSYGCDPWRQNAAPLQY